MDKRFTASEVIEIAMDIETNGAYFYSEYARSAREPGIRDLFRDLASMEKRHYDEFRIIKDSLKNSGIDTEFPGDQKLYLKALAEENVFIKSEIDYMVAPENLVSSDEALDFAVDLEYSSIMFYNTIRPFIARGERRYLDKIIDEESKHVTTLEGLKRKIA